MAKMCCIFLIEKIRTCQLRHSREQVQRTILLVQLIQNDEGKDKLTSVMLSSIKKNIIEQSWCHYAFFLPSRGDNERNWCFHHFRRAPASHCEMNESFSRILPGIRFLWGWSKDIWQSYRKKTLDYSFCSPQCTITRRQIS